MWGGDSVAPHPYWISPMINDRLAAYAAVAADLGVDAVALVPGPNFTRAI
jgi:hypothetical protein